MLHMLGQPAEHDGHPIMEIRGDADGAREYPMDQWKTLLINKVSELMPNAQSSILWINPRRSRGCTMIFWQRAHGHVQHRH